MNKIINEKHLKTIKYELKYYSNYCSNDLCNKINNFLLENNDKQLKEIIYNCIRGEINDLVLYFYSHTDQDGNILSINSSIINNDFIKKNKSIFVEINNLFLKNLFANEKPLFFFDVDNTLTDRGFLSQEKIDYISSFKDKNNIILSTGKVSDAIMNVLTDCQIKENYYSCLNGSVIHKQDDFILMNKVGKVSKDIIEKLMMTEITFVFYYYNCIKVIKPLLKKDIDNLNRFNEKFSYCDEEINYDNIVKVLAFIDDDHTDESKAKENIIREIIKDYKELHCIRTAPHTFEILRIDQHKGNSVKRIAEIKGKYYRLTVGVGDSMNDFKMLEYMGYPFVVSNVSDELREYDFEILEDNRNVDIVNLIKRFER